MSRPTILVVEDNPVLQKVIELFARKHDVAVDTAYSASEALQKLNQQSHPYDLVFMDWKLPDMDGLECTRVIREMEGDSRRHLPIVAMTGNVSDDCKHECLAAGMDDFMSKPFSNDQFWTMVSRWTDSAGAKAHGA